MAPTRIEWAEVPAHDDDSTPTREAIAAGLAKRPGKWAIVGRHDRAARAETHSDRIESGREYGNGFESIVRRVGNQHLVYARRSPADVARG